MLPAGRRAFQGSGKAGCNVLGGVCLWCCEIPNWWMMTALRSFQWQSPPKGRGAE